MMPMVAVFQWEKLSAEHRQSIDLVLQKRSKSFPLPLWYNSVMTC